MMLVREAQLKNGTKAQYQAIDEAILTAQFVRNKAVRFGMDHVGIGKVDLYTLCKALALEFPFAKKLNSAARQASVERAWASISRFYSRCKKGEKKKGFPQLKKYSRSVEYKVSGWKLSEDCTSINFTEGFAIGSLSLFCNQETRFDLLRLRQNLG